MHSEFDFGLFRIFANEEEEKNKKFLFKYQFGSDSVIKKECKTTGIKFSAYFPKSTWLVLLLSSILLFCLSPRSL